MAGFDLGIESNISTNIENDIICMKKIVLQLNLKEKYKSIDFLWIKSHDSWNNSYLLLNAKNTVRIKKY